MFSLLGYHGDRYGCEVHTEVLTILTLKFYFSPS